VSLSDEVEDEDVCAHAETGSSIADIADEARRLAILMVDFKTMVSPLCRSCRSVIDRVIQRRVIQRRGTAKRDKASSPERRPA
jgi:hypothetical protein